MDSTAGWLFLGSRIPHGTVEEAGHVFIRDTIYSIIEEMPVTAKRCFQRCECTIYAIRFRT